MKMTVSRTHAFCYGHRVYGHESKCAHLHGHEGLVTFTIRGPNLDNIGRVLDFSAIKERLCNWVEDNWDHKFIMFSGDPLVRHLIALDPSGVWNSPFNPTAENFAKYLLEEVGPKQLAGTGTELIEVKFEETRKCYAVLTKENL